MPISTSSHSGSTVANRAAAANSFTAYWSRPSLSSHSPTDLWSNLRHCRPSETAIYWGYGSQVNTHLRLFSSFLGADAPHAGLQMGESIRDAGLHLGSTPDAMCTGAMQRVFGGSSVLHCNAWLGNTSLPLT